MTDKQKLKEIEHIILEGNSEEIRARVVKGIDNTTRLDTWVLLIDADSIITRIYETIKD